MAATITSPQSDADPLVAMRLRCAQPVDRLQELRWLSTDVQQFLDNDMADTASDDEPAGQRFASANDAVEALQIAEFLRRSADAITVQVMDDVAGSSVVDEHGHASVRAMYDTATSQSSRDLYGLEQVRKMFHKCPDIKAAAYNADLSWEHLRLLARVYANRRVRSAFIDQQGWFLRKAGRFDFRRFEILVNRWEEVNDTDGPEPDDAFVKRTASATQDHFSKAWHRTSTHSPQIGAAMADVENVYIEAEFAKDWEAAKAIHGDKTCKANLARTDAQRRADAQAQIYADAAANPNASVSFNFVHHIVCSLDVHLEMARRYQGAAPRPFDLDTFRCETIDGKQLDPTETFMDSLTSPFRRVIMDAKGVVIDVSERRFFTGIARTALQISHDECEWPGCHVPASRCQGDHTLSRQNGGPTTQANGSILCQRHNRHKERGYTVWRDPVAGDLHIKTPLGTQIC